MQPDEMWSGNYNKALGKNFTSKSEYNRFLKQKGLTRIEAGMEKDRENSIKHEDKKIDNERRKTMEKVAMEW